MSNSKQPTKKDTLIAISLILNVTILALVGAGVITPQQGNEFSSNVTQLANLLNERVSDLNATLITTWSDTIGDPAFYTTQQPYAYIISNISGYYCLQNGVNGYLQAYNPSYTTIETTALSSTTQGSIITKEVPFDLELMNSIPTNVQVICNYQGVSYTYINPASSLGSPYTVSVGTGVNAGNYIAEDSENRITYTSTDAYTLFNDIVTAKSVYVNSGSYDFGTNKLILTTNNATWSFADNATILSSSSPFCVGSSGNFIDRVTIINPTFQAYGNALSSNTAVGFETVNSRYGTYKNIKSLFFNGTGLLVNASGTNMYDASNYFYQPEIHATHYGIQFTGTGGYVIPNDDHIIGGETLGVLGADSSSIGVYMNKVTTSEVQMDIEGYNNGFSLGTSATGNYIHPRIESVTTGFYIASAASGNTIENNYGSSVWTGLSGGIGTNNTFIGSGYELTKEVAISTGQTTYTFSWSTPSFETESAPYIVSFSPWFDSGAWYVSARSTTSVTITWTTPTSGTQYANIHVGISK